MLRAELDGLVVFLVVAEQKGFRAAARQLGLTPSAVSQSVQNLERRVGAALFLRTTRTVGLTEAGQQLLAHARPAADLFRAGLEAARGLGEQPSGHLRINTTRASLPLLINRLLPDFHETYPKIRLELIGEDNFIDIIERGFDAGIRLGHVVEVDMVSTWLTQPEKYTVVGAPGFFEKHGRPTQPEDLQKLPAILIQRSGQISRTWEFTRDGQDLRVAVDGPLVLNESEMCIRAALRGVGLFYTLRSMIAGHIKQGNLEVVLEKFGKDVPGLSLYYPSQSRSLPKLRAFVEFATKRMRARIEPEAFSAQPLLRR